jgi:hypothetical protein
MKKFFVFAALLAVAAFVSCQKQQTDAEKNTEVERQVQERLAAEHQAEQQQQLQQRQTDLDAREKALTEKENTAVATPARRERSEPEPVTRSRAVSGARPTSGYSTFYTKLEPHGAWLETSDYGYVWQPREAESSRSWRPYTNGRWVYTDAGWTWISEEPFGWATYHYGRWTRLRGIGWVWVPGDQWAPAWVSWRKSNDYVGWAPLPPEARFDQRTGIHNWSDNYYDIGPDQYSFVPTREFGAQRIESTIVPSERNVTIINQTTNVTNITYNNTTVVNEGPNYDELRTQSREPMQRFRLERNLSVDVNVEAPRPLVQGQTVVLAAPVIAAPVTSERPPTVKQNITQITVDLGWAGITDQEAAKKARQKMKSEATPPSNVPSKKFIKAAATTTAASPASETPASSTSVSATPLPSATMSTTEAPSAAPTSTPEPKMTSPKVTSFEQSPTPAATSTPTSSASPLSTASQRRGRLLVPSATPPPRTTPSATPKPTASNSPTASDTVSSTQIPAPSASPAVTSGAIQERSPQGKFKSQAQKFQPRKIEPMPSASPSPAVTSTSSPNSTSTPLSSPGAKLIKQEKKEQKREERKELKRERTEGFENASPSPSPQSSP